MIDYNNEICDKCTRISSCTHPCSNYQDYMFIHNLEKAYKEEILIDNVDYKCKDNDISDFLEFGVESIEWLRVCNSQITYTELLDKNALQEYFKSENEKYCEEQGICNVCRNPLIEFTEKEDGMTSEKYWNCSYGC